MAGLHFRKDQITDIIYVSTGKSTNAFCPNCFVNVNLKNKFLWTDSMRACRPAIPAPMGRTHNTQIQLFISNR